MRQMNIIRSENHDIQLIKVNKIALSADDDKRIIGDEKFKKYFFFKKSVYH